MSQRLCLERLPNESLHNQKPIVTLVNKQSLAMFETQARKDMPGLQEEGPRKPYSKPKPFTPLQNQGGPHIVHGLPPPGANVVSASVLDPNLLHAQGLPIQPQGLPPGAIIVDAMGNIIQGGIPGQGLPLQGPPTSAGGPMHGMPPRPGIAPHINPAFIPQDGAPIDPATGMRLHTAGMNEQDLESMRRNQAVASTAIQRAMTDANAGEFESGIETLVTAISLIKQSTTSNTEPAQVLIQSLQDCLQGLEGQLVHKGSHPSRNRFDPRDQDRHRRRRRDRSRSHSRGRRSYSPHRSRSRDRRERRR